MVTYGNGETYCETCGIFDDDPPVDCLFMKQKRID